LLDKLQSKDDWGGGYERGPLTRLMKEKKNMERIKESYARQTGSVRAEPAHKKKGKEEEKNLSFEEK